MKKIFFVLIIAIANINAYCQLSEKPFSKEKDRAEYDKQVLLHRKTINDSSVYKIFEMINNEKDVEKRAEMILYSGNIDNKQLLPYLIGVLKNDTSQLVLVNCIEALKQQNASSAIPDLISIKNRLNDENRLKLASCLSWLGEKNESYNILQNIDKQKISEQRLKLFYIQIMGNIATPAAIDTIRNYLSCGNKIVEAYAGVILAQLGQNDDAYAKLSILINDENYQVRGSAIAGLCYIGDEKSVQLIATRINDENKSVCQSVKMALKRFKKL